MNEYIYIVSWVVANFVSTPCNASPNPYGYNSMSNCAVLHGRYVYTNYKKAFSTKDSAVAFINNGEQTFAFSMSNIRNFKLDSTSDQSIKNAWDEGFELN